MYGNGRISYMKFALINVYYQYGSTGKGIKKNYNRLKELGHEVKVFYGANRQKVDDPNIVYFGVPFNRVVHLFGCRYFGLEGSLSNIATLKLLKYLDEYKPDVIWLLGMHGYYLNWNRLFSYIKRKRIFTVYGMVDEYPFLGKCCSSFECEKYLTGCHHCEHLKEYPESLIFDNSKWIFNKKKKAYEGWDNIIFRSAPYVVDKASKSMLLKGKEFATTDSSVDMNIFYPRHTEKLREKLSIPEGAKVALLCAANSNIYKGAEYFISAARLCEDDNIFFVQVSFDGDKSELPDNFRSVDFVSSQDSLAEYYSLADVYVCTSKSDAQPNACLEALGCGTPIVGFNISGVPFIAPNEFGTFVEPFDVRQLAQAIRDVPRKSEERIAACRTYAFNRFSIEAIDKVHREFVEYLVNRVEKNKGEQQ